MLHHKMQPRLPGGMLDHVEQRHTVGTTGKMEMGSMDGMVALERCCLPDS